MMRRISIQFTMIVFLSLIATLGSARELRSTEKNVISDAIRGSLRDPESARFTWPPYVDGVDLYCGYVNAKNSFGGYVGDTRFSAFVVLVEGEIRVAALVGIATGDPDSSQTFAVEQTCSAKGY